MTTFCCLIFAAFCMKILMPSPQFKKYFIVQIIFIKTMHPAYKGIYTNTYFGIRTQNLLFWLESDCAKPLQLQTLQCKNERSGKGSGRQGSLICSIPLPPFGSSLAGSSSVFEPKYSAVFWVRGQPWAAAMIRAKKPCLTSSSPCSGIKTEAWWELLWHLKWTCFKRHVQK